MNNEMVLQSCEWNDFTMGLIDERFVLREHLLWLLDGGDAHVSFETATANLPYELQGSRPAGFLHTPWQLLEHLRICQWDILEFSRSDWHVSPEFPDGYWPDSEVPPDEHAWQGSLDSFHRDMAEIREIVSDLQTDLLKPFAWGDGQTMLREVLLMADHNAYHIGQLVILRKALGAWNP